MDAGNTRELGFEMEHRAEIGLVAVQIGERASQQRKQLGLVVIGLGAKLDQLDEIRSRPGPAKTLPNSGKRILQHDFRERMEIRFPAPGDLNFRLEKQVELSGECALRPARAFGRGLDAA
jgi:hypothetical protein